MTQYDKAALDLLASNTPINNDRGRQIFLDYLRRCDATSASPMDKVFEIVITYFKPEGLYLNGLNPRQQKELILYIIGQGDKDATLDTYLKKLADLDEENIKTEKDLTKVENKFDTFKGEVEQVDDNAEYGVVFSYVIEEPKPKKDDDPTKPKPKVLKWSITDSVTGKRKTGQEILPETADINIETTKVLDDYMTDRPKLIQDRQRELIREIKNKHHQLGSIMDDKSFNEYLKGNYENFQQMRTDQTETKRRLQIVPMRTQLQKELQKDKSNAKMNS